MPVFRSNEGKVPKWCELEHFEILELGAEQELRLPRRSSREIVLVTYGTGMVSFPNHSMIFYEPQFIAVPDHVESYTVGGTFRPAQFVRFCGRWGTELGGCTIFRVSLEARSRYVGDPVSYPKATSFDSHYHDYDEYWVILEGSGTVVVGHDKHIVRPGDCIAVGMGHHHDFPLVDAPVKAAALETTVLGAKRLGHLWVHTHGPAQPDPNRT